ncbi:hypothetical protein JCM8547_001847 [Rhodosporidiobolus lusitaniae]
MLDDPFVLAPADRTHALLPYSSASHSSTALSSTSFLLAPHLSPSRPSFGASHSFRTSLITFSEPSSSGGSAVGSLKRRAARVHFSPTPLASLKSSPRHKRPYEQLLLASPGKENEGEVGGEGRKRRRKNVYSANPLFARDEEEEGVALVLSGQHRMETMEQQEGESLSSGASPVSTSFSTSKSARENTISPPTSSSSAVQPAAQLLLPPTRLSALRVSTVCAASPPKSLSFSSAAFLPTPPNSSLRAATPTTFRFTPPHNLRPFLVSHSSSGGSNAGEPVMPFRLPGQRPVFYDSALEAGPEHVSPTVEDEELEPETDDETESQDVASLLLPASAPSHSPAKPSASFSFTLPIPSSSSALSSSSPLPSPSRTRPARRPSTSLTAGLKSILKPRAAGVSSGVGLTVKDEREGRRRNERGRRHVVGWEDCMVAAMATAGEARDAGEGGEKRAAAGSLSARTRASGTRREGGMGRKEGGNAREGGNGNGARGQPPPPRPPVPSTSAGGGGNTIPYAVQPDDPILLLTPLRTLKASLRTTSAGYIRPLSSHDPSASLVSRLTSGEDIPSSAFTAPTLLSDVEEAYILLTHAIFRLPPTLSSSTSAGAETLAPLKELRSVLLACVRREVGNIHSFPSWVASQPPPPSPTLDGARSGSSSPASSPLKKDANAGGKGGKKGKRSLTEEQMRRMRDELGAAQAALKCVAAVGRDKRVWGVFADNDLTSLLSLICSLPASSSTLSPLVQKDLFPFIPFLISSLSLPSHITTPLLSPSLLPALRGTLTLSPKIDRYRLSLSTSLDALTRLIVTHPRAVFYTQERGGNVWKIWFRPAMAGLWEGPKKGLGTRDKAVRVAGAVVRALTASVEEEGEEGRKWVERREKVAKSVGVEMLALLHDAPTDGAIDPDTGKPITYLQMLSSGLQVSPPTPGGSPQPGEEVLHLQNLSILALLPPLLSGSFRKLNEKGISPWIQPFNLLFQSPSPHILALSALAWSHLTYAFLRTSSDKGGDAWMFRKPDARPFDLLLSMYKTRALGAWRKTDNLDPKLVTPARKHSQKAHAKALALAFAASLYGVTVYIRQGMSSVRSPLPSSSASAAPSLEELDPPLTPRQMEHFDLVFARLVAPYLPRMARTGVSQDAPVIGWTLLSSLLRPRTTNDSKAVLEALVNPAFLNGSLAGSPAAAVLTPAAAAAAAGKVELLTAAALQSAVQPGRVPGWGREWVRERVEKVLKVVEACLPREEEGTLGEVVQPHYIVGWQNLLRTLSLPAPPPHASTDPSAPASAPSAPSAPLDRVLSWLSNLSTSHPTAAAALWTATLARPEEDVVQGIEKVLEEEKTERRKEVRVVEEVTRAWIGMKERGERYGEMIARGWTSVLQSAGDVTLTPDQLELIVLLLRLQADSPAPTDSGIVLARALNTVVWTDSPASRNLLSHLVTLVFAPSEPSSDLRLCALLVSSSRDFDVVVQEHVLALSEYAVGTLLSAEAVSDESIALIGRLLEAASDDAFPKLYSFVLDKLAPYVKPTNASLQRLSPLLAPSLRRASDLIFSHLPAESQFETQASLQQSLVSHSAAAHPSHRPFLFFNRFWRKTFGRAEEDLDYPPDLVDSLAILRSLLEDFPAPNLGESQGMSLEVEPVPGQVAPSRATTVPTAASTALPDVSTRSYDADTSALPRQTADESSSFEQSFNSPPRQVRAPSPSLRDPDHFNLPSTEGVEPSQEEDGEEDSSLVKETPLKVEKMRARASIASLVSSAAAKQQDRVEAEGDKGLRRSLRKAGGEGEKEKDRKGKKREVEELVIEDSEDEVIVAREPMPPVKKPSSPPRKKARRSAGQSRRSSSSSAPASDPEPAAPVASTSTRTTRRRSHAAFELDIIAPARKKRKSPKTRSRASKAASSSPRDPSAAAKEVPTSSPALNSVRSSSPEELPPSEQEDVVRRFFGLPIDTALRLGREFGGTKSLKRLMDLGERAKEYFESLSQSSSSP